ncbi:MAG: hypothetical protein ABWY45_01405 [Mycobacterium sp.]
MSEANRCRTVWIKDLGCVTTSLAARSRGADEAFTRLFPMVVESPLVAYDPLGTGAG